MIIIDFSQILHAQIALELARNKANPDEFIREDLLRHFILNQIQAINARFKKNYGKMVFALEGRMNWRYTKFKHYKANRKTGRDASTVNWDGIFSVTNKIIAELSQEFPAPFISAEGFEADDIISFLTQSYAAPGQPVMIVSSDKDFSQLQILNKIYGERVVEQWAPTTDRLIVARDPVDELKGLIVRGDKGDGVPSVLCPDYALIEPGFKAPMMTANRINAVKDCFDIVVNDKSVLFSELTEGFVSTVIHEDKLSALCEDWKRKKPAIISQNVNLVETLNRNNAMINLFTVPMDDPRVSAMFEKAGELFQRVIPASKFMFYLNKNKLKVLTEKINNFY